MLGGSAPLLTRFASSLLSGSSTAFRCFTLLSSFLTLLRADRGRMGCSSSDRTSFSPAPARGPAGHDAASPGRGAAAASSPTAGADPAQPELGAPGQAAGALPGPRDLTFAADVELRHLGTCLCTLRQLPPARGGTRIKQETPPMPPPTFPSSSRCRGRSGRAAARSLSAPPGQPRRGTGTSRRAEPREPLRHPHSPPPPAEGADRLQEPPVPPLAVLLPLA